MNLSLDQYIDGFERSVRELPTLLDEWDTAVEVELQTEYADQLEWMLLERSNVLVRAAQEGRFEELRKRLDAITALLRPLRKRVTEKMSLALWLMEDL